MNATRIWRGATICLAVCAVTLATSAAQEKPKSDAPPQEQKPDEAARGEFQIGSVRLLTLKPITFFYTSFETTLADMHEQVQKTITDLMKAAEDAKLRPGMPTILIFHGVNGDPQTKFTLDVGFAAPQGTKATGDYKVKELPEHRCASLLFTGPVAQIGHAYEKLMPALGDLNKKPTDESRQMYLYWEGPDSPNNVVQITVGVEQ